MSHSLGAIAVSQDGDRYVNSIIIRKNKTIPISESRSFKHKTRRNSDNEMEVYLTQGEGTEVKECTVVGRYMIRNIEYVNGGESIIDLQYSYDDSIRPFRLRLLWLSTRNKKTFSCREIISTG